MNYETPDKRLAFLQKEVLDPNSEIYLENLLDLAISVTYDIHSSGTWKNSKPIKSFLDRYSNFSDKIYKYRLSLADFQCIKTIGQGGFGRVDLVKHNVTKNVYAMKVIEKSTYINNNFNGFWEERDILTQNVSDWLVKCFYTFMDLKKLYIVMEYMPGGNLYHWLETLEEFNEEQTHFYAMEMILAIEVIHRMQYLHRDIKPDNMLLDKSGHLKLADFGTCIKVENGKVQTNFQVGTPDYIAPEVLSHGNVKDLVVGLEIDWWAFGIVLYELFYGETPFEGEATSTIYRNIMLYKTTLTYPDDKPASDYFYDFMKNLLTDPNKRMNIDQIKNHPYMTKSPFNWTFDTIHNFHSPIVFEVSNEADTQHATYDPSDKRNNIASSFANNNFFSGENLAFAGFTFNRFHTYGEKDISIKGNSYDISALVELERKLSEIESSKQTLSTKLDQNMSDLSVLQTKLSNAENELLGKEQRIMASNNEQNQTLEVNKQLKARIEISMKECEMSKREIESLKLSIVEKDVLIKSLKTELTDEAENYCNLKKNLEQMEQKLLNVSLDLEDKNTQLENLSKIENTLEDERNISKDLAADINTKNRKIVEYEKQLELLNDRISDLNSQNSKINAVKINQDDQAKELSTLKERYDKLLREKQAVESNLNLLKTDYNEIKSDRDLIRSELKTVILKKTAFEKTREKLKKDLVEITAQLNIQKNKLCESEDKMKIMKQELNDNETEKELLKTECKMHKSMAVVKRLEIEEAYVEFEELKEQHEKMKSELEAERSSLSDKVMILNSELSGLKVVFEDQKLKLNIMDSIKSENNELYKTVDNLKSDLNRMKEELEKLSERNKDQEIELKKAEEETAMHKQKVAVLVKKIEEMISNPKGMQTYRKKKEVVDKESNKRVKQMENEITKYKENIQNNRQEVVELKNECQLWREKFADLEKELEKKTNVINHLKSKLGDDSKSDDIPILDEESEKNMALNTSLIGKVEMMQKKGKGRQKISWIPYFARLQPFQINFSLNETDQVPLLSIQLRDVIHIKETTQADCVHVDKTLLPQMIQIIYNKPEVEDNRRVSVMSTTDNSRRVKGSNLLSVDESSASMRLSNTSLSGILNIENHSFVHVKCRSSQFCDFCHQPCSDYFNPPAVLECSKCKQRIHEEHINDKKFPACSEAMENLSIKLESPEARSLWLKRFKLLKQYQKTDEIRLGPNTFYRSFNMPFSRYSPNNNAGDTGGPQ